MRSGLILAALLTGFASAGLSNTAEAQHYYGGADLYGGGYWGQPYYYSGGSDYPRYSYYRPGYSSGLYGHEPWYGYYHRPWSGGYRGYGYAPRKSFFIQGRNFGFGYYDFD